MESVEVQEMETEQQRLRDNASRYFKFLEESILSKMLENLESKLFSLNNFFESKTILLYANLKNEVPTKSIMRKTLDCGKTLVLPFFQKNGKVLFMAVKNLNKDLKKGPRGVLQPNANTSKTVPTKIIDVAVVPALCIDEKCCRMGTGQKHYSKIMPQLPITTRRIGLTFEKLIRPKLPMKRPDNKVDIVITEKRVIYRI